MCGTAAERRAGQELQLSFQMRCVESVQDDAVGSSQDWPSYYYHLCQLGASSITEKTRKMKLWLYLGEISPPPLIMIDPGIHTKQVNETEKNCSKLLLDSTHNYQHIQLVFKNVPPSTTFLHLFLWRNSNSDDKKYITSSVEPGEICNIAFIANILLLAKKKCGSFL